MAEPAHRTRLVVLFGGRSAEREVSCVTAACVLAAVDRARYDVVPIGITPEGAWVEAAERPGALLAEGRPVEPFTAVAGADVVLPLLHGPLGEDGTVQGLLEVAAVPYVGSGVLGSAVAMDKAMTKEVLARAGLPQAAWQTAHASALPDPLEVGRALGYPVFVKPANMGSSVGVTKAHDEHELGDACTLALRYDELIIIEEAIVGREVECAVLGNLHPQATLLGEIVPSHEFYDYDDKYSGEGAELIVPTDLPDDVMAEGQRLAVAAFKALRCEGMARVDFFYDAGGRGLLINEVNTIPGFTPFSMYPQLWEAAGLPYAALIDRLVELAQERFHRRQAHTGKGRGIA